MVGIYLNPTNKGFTKSLRSEIYVDKTDIIIYTNKVLDTEQRYICVSRPRRFGKTMTASMLTAYYSRGCDSSKLFENLSISKSSSYRHNLNQYNVIFLNIQQFLSGAKSIEEAICTMQEKLIEEMLKAYPHVSELTLQDDLIGMLQVIYYLRVKSLTIQNCTQIRG